MKLSRRSFLKITALGVIATQIPVVDTRNWLQKEIDNMPYNTQILFLTSTYEEYKPTLSNEYISETFEYGRMMGIARLGELGSY